MIVIGLYLISLFIKSAELGEPFVNYYCIFRQQNFTYFITIVLHKKLIYYVLLHGMSCKWWKLFCNSNITNNGTLPFFFLQLMYAFLITVNTSVPIEMVYVCPGEQTALICETNNYSLLEWKITVPKHQQTEHRYISVSLVAGYLVAGYLIFRGPLNMRLRHWYQLCSSATLVLI